MRIFYKVIASAVIIVGMVGVANGQDAQLQEKSYQMAITGKSGTKVVLCVILDDLVDRLEVTLPYYSNFNAERMSIMVSSRCNGKVEGKMITMVKEKPQESISAKGIAMLFHISPKKASVVSL